MAKKPIGIYSEKNNFNVKNSESENFTQKISNLPIFPPKFKLSFDNCKDDIRDIFINLIKLFEFYPIKQKAVDKPDYRFSKKYVFCTITIHHNSLLIELRVDNNEINSDLFILEEIKDKTKPGIKWLKFKIYNIDQLEDSFKIIDRVYKFSE